MVYWLSYFSSPLSAYIDALNEFGAPFDWPGHILQNGARVDYDICQGLRIERDEEPGIPGMNSVFPLARLKMKRKTPFPDLFGTTNRVLLASDRFRDVVEDLEPGRHQFFPVRILHSKSDDVFAERYIFNICTRLDCIADRSKRFNRVVWARCCDGLHVWRDGPWGGEVYMSERLIKEIRKRKIKIGVFASDLIKAQTV